MRKRRKNDAFVLRVLGLPETENDFINRPVKISVVEVNFFVQCCLLNLSAAIVSILAVGLA